MRWRTILSTACAFGVVCGITYSRANIIISGSAGPPPGSCSDSTSLFNRIAALSGTPTLDTTHHNAADAFICTGLVATGVWAKMDAMWVPAINTASGSNTEVANINWKNTSPSFTLVAHGSPTFTADQGYTGGTDFNNTVWLDTGFSPANNGVQFQQNTAHIALWSPTTQGTSSNFAAAMGAADSSNNHNAAVIPHASDGNEYCDVNYTIGGAATNAMTPVAPIGMMVCVRTGASLGVIYRNAVSQTLVEGPSTSVAQPVSNLQLLNGSYGTGEAGGGPFLIGFASIGGALTSTDVTNLHTGFCTYMTSIGQSC